MMHPDTALATVDPDIGLGVVATRLIPKGTIVFAKDQLDIELPPNHPLIDHPAYQDLIEKYAYSEPDGTRVIAWDIAKYINHCCQPSTLSTGYGFEIAIKDLQPGDEITDDYAIFSSIFRTQLICQHQPCRQYVRPDDFDRCYPEWDGKIRDALAFLRGVDQPLLPLLDPQTAADLHRYLDTAQGYRSISQAKPFDPRSAPTPTPRQSTAPTARQ